MQPPSRRSARSSRLSIARCAATARPPGRPFGDRAAWTVAGAIWPSAEPAGERRHRRRLNRPDDLAHVGSGSYLIFVCFLFSPSRALTTALVCWPNGCPRLVHAKKLKKIFFLFRKVTVSCAAHTFHTYKKRWTHRFPLVIYGVSFLVICPVRILPFGGSFPSRTHPHTETHTHTHTETHMETPGRNVVVFPGLDWPIDGGRRLIC